MDYCKRLISFSSEMEHALVQYEMERTDTNFKRTCMFCHMEFCGSRIAYIEHLYQKHNLYLGKPENLVFLDELLDKIENNIKSLICIYCERIFKSRVVLKEHMRKKFHKYINPNNKVYDKFYIVNYLETEKSQTQRGSDLETNLEPGNSSSDNEDEESSWSDWNDESIGITCLFCNYKNKEFTCISKHMIEEHSFDFEETVKDLNFYQKVKVVNYVRNQIELHRCIFCEENTDNVLEHMKSQQHYKVAKQKVWDQPQYYFPMSENDSFLYNLDASSNSDEDSNIEDLSEAMCDLRAFFTLYKN